MWCGKVHVWHWISNKVADGVVRSEQTAYLFLMEQIERDGKHVHKGRECQGEEGACVHRVQLNGKSKRRKEPKSIHLEQIALMKWWTYEAVRCQWRRRGPITEEKKERYLTVSDRFHFHLFSLLFFLLLQLSHSLLFSPVPSSFICL